MEKTSKKCYNHNSVRNYNYYYSFFNGGISMNTTLIEEIGVTELKRFFQETVTANRTLPYKYGSSLGFAKLL